MTDNTTLQSTTLATPPAGLVVATDSIGGVDYQRVKLTIGADGTATDVSAGSGANGTGAIRVTVATDDTLVSSLATKLDTIATDIVAATGPVGRGTIPAAPRVTAAGCDYETVAASQTSQALGGTGATGDFLSHVTVSPATVSPGVVTVLDNATAIVSFPGGTNSVTDLKPFTIYVGLISKSGAWKITTGANVSCVGCGDFTA